MRRVLVGSVFAVSVLAAHTASGVGAPQSPEQSVPVVPEYVLDVAQHGSVHQFGEALAVAEVPAGVVIARADWTFDSTRAFGFDRLMPSPRSTVLTEFQRRHPSYRVRERRDGGSFVIEPLRHRCTQPLSTRLNSFEASGSVLEVFDLIRKALDPAAPQPAPGLVGGGPLPPPGSGANLEAHRTMVAINLGATSLEDVFFEVVRQAPGVVWGIHEEINRRDGRADCRFHFYSGRSFITTSWTLAR